MKHKGNVYDSIKNYIRSKQNIQLEYEKIEKLKKKNKKTTIYLSINYPGRDSEKCIKKI